MRINHGIIEHLSFSWARYIKENGGDSSVSENTLRFTLQLWLSLIFICLFTISSGFFLNTLNEAIIGLGTIGLLRYFSGGWHFKQLDICVIFTTFIVTIIPFVPELSREWLFSLNTLSLVLVFFLAPTGHGQLFKSTKQKQVFKWISIMIIFINYFLFHQVAIISALIQSLTLITIDRGKG